MGRRFLLPTYPTSGPLEISPGKYTEFPAFAVSNTSGTRLNIGRHVGWHADPVPDGLTELRLRSALRFVYGFHPTRPRGGPRTVTSRIARVSPDWRRSRMNRCDSPFGLVQLPSTHGCLQSGSIKNFHLRLCEHAGRTTAGPAGGGGPTVMAAGRELGATLFGG